MKCLAYLAVALAACGVDNRPKTIEYATEAVLAPSCGAAQCHSTFSGNLNDIFDTVAGTRASLVRNGLIVFDSTQYDPGNPQNALLIQWLTQTDPLNAGVGRMPYDAPMPQEDIRFLEQFIAAKAPGAQCDPDPTASDYNAGYACDDYLLTRCLDWSFGPVVHSCTGPNETGCAAGVCTCTSGWGSCGDPALGCQTQLNVDGDCGACGVQCDPPTSMPRTNKTCQPKSATSAVYSCQCPVGTGDCPASSAVGCKTDLTVNGNCGACGVTCTGAQTCQQTPMMPAGVFSCQ